MQFVGFLTLIADAAPTAPSNSVVCAAPIPGLIVPTFWIALMLFNIVALALIIVAVRGINWDQVLQEKALIPAALAAAAAAPGGDQGGAQPDVPQSSSRVISTLGGMLIVAFFFACCNISLFWGFNDPQKVMAFAQGVWPLFLAGSALFLPYAFNQLQTIFPSKK